MPRRLVVWLGAEGLDAETAERMRAAGVDEVVVRRGSMNLAGRAPVLRFNPMPPVVPGRTPIFSSIKSLSPTKGCSVSGFG